MGKKTGQKATYEIYGGAEVKEVIKGKEIGLSFNHSKKAYYTMIPKEFAGAGAKRSKQIWLKSDLDNAVLRFRAMVAELKGEKEVMVDTTITTTLNPWGYGPILDNYTGKLRLHKITQPASEEQYIKWLKNELQNPSELARKTGIDAFNHFYDWMLEVPITLDTLIHNFFNLRKKPISHKEKQKTENAWLLFCKITEKKTVQEVCLADIQKYGDYIHSKGYAPATLSHYLNRVAKVFNYNSDKFEDNGRIIKIAKWCESMERLRIIKSEPEIIELKVFETLYNNTHILLKDNKRNSPNIDLAMKAMLTMGLNTASTLIDLSRLTKDEIDLDMRTLSTRRQKTGQVKKVAYLWERTTKDLKAYLDSRKDSSPYVFLSRTGTAYTDSGLRKLFKRYRRELKLPDTVEFNLLRKTFSTVAKDIDIDPFKVNCVMGHSNKGMVDTYSKRQISNNLKEACLAVEKDYFQEDAIPLDF